MWFPLAQQFERSSSLPEIPESLLISSGNVPARSCCLCQLLDVFYTHQLFFLWSYCWVQEFLRNTSGQEYSAALLSPLSQIEHIVIHCALRINHPTTNPPRERTVEVKTKQEVTLVAKKIICFPKQFLHFSGKHRLKCYLLIIQISESISPHFFIFSLFRTLPLSSTPPYCPPSPCC